MEEDGCMCVVLPLPLFCQQLFFFILLTFQEPQQQQNKKHQDCTLRKYVIESEVLFFIWCVSFGLGGFL
jgi:hypothetical protein